MFARLMSLDRIGAIPLDRGLVLVGREPVCHARLASSRVSRLHCSLYPLADGVLVYDLESTNGTWINDRRVKQGVVRPGDVLTIANLRYRCELSGVQNGGAAGESWPETWCGLPGSDQLAAPLTAATCVAPC
jgi:predicted component of type VI protein secretion system